MNKDELLRGARESMERDQAKLDWQSKHPGWYTDEDVARFRRDIDLQAQRINGKDSIDL